MLSVAEVAAKLRIHETTVYRLIKDGDISAEKRPLGFDRRQALRIASDELQRFIDERRVGAA
jgi:excisionase family DNA binding protein